MTANLIAISLICLIINANRLELTNYSLVDCLFNRVNWWRSTILLLE